MSAGPQLKPGQSTEEKHSLERQTPFCDFPTNLPGELLCMILDYLDYSCLPGVQLLPHSPAGDSYWRRRVRPYLTEFEEIRDQDLDWQFLCLKIEELDSTTDLFRTRKRLLRVLDEIKMGILEKLEEGQKNHVEYFKGVIKTIELDRAELRHRWYGCRKRLTQCCMRLTFIISRYD